MYLNTIYFNLSMQHGSKAAFLKKLTERYQFKSVDIGTNLDGSSPPGVFVGKYGYPKVFVGPLLTKEHGDTSIMDKPEDWIPKSNPQEVIDHRLNLVRGKSMIGVKELDNKLVQQMREIAMAKNSVESEAEFTKKPRGFMIHEETQPFGPSAELSKFNVGNVKWEQKLEKVYYDNDLKAQDAVLDSYKKGVLISQIQKAFSIGTMGIDRNRKLVPTRWSITAVDDIIGKDLVSDIKQNPLINEYRVYEFKAFNNYFAILLTPTLWQYEWTEAFIKLMDNRVAIFSDFESNSGKKEYSSVGGCFYSVRLAVAEKLKEEKRQSGALVFREAYPGYVPLGVWLCRELSRTALKQKPQTFDSLSTALNYLSTKIRLPIETFKKESTLLYTPVQTALSKFV